jgi:membrane-associated phospholipid phosphatase
MKTRIYAASLTLALCTCAIAPQRALAQAISTADSATLSNAGTLSAAGALSSTTTTQAPPRPLAVSPLAPSLTGIFQDLVTDFRRLPSRETASLLGFGAAAAMMGHSVDRSVTVTLSRPTAFGHALEPGNIVGGFQFQLGGALATYTVGRITKNPKVATVGADLVRAHIVSQTITGAVKVAAHRTRPDGTNLSFPSGHTSASFATAAVLQRHFGWKVGVPAMGVAAYVAAARIHDKRHFLSDVAFGASIGLAAGRTVTIGHGRGQFAVAPAVAPGGGGVAFTWVGR